MRFKFPKSIVIGNVKFKVVYDKSTMAASFKGPTDKDIGVIKLGTKALKTEPMIFLSNVIHETKELIQYEQATRFERVDEVSYEFHYNHQQHTDLCDRLAHVIAQFIK